MDHYEGVRQSLDAKPPHLIADFKFHLYRVKDVFGVPKDELAVDWYHPDEPISSMWEAALPRIEEVEGQQVIIDSTPEGDNHYYDLWNKVNEDDANIPDYLKEWINLINFQRQQEQNIKPLPITVGILSWASHSTLRNTLQSYKDNGLFESVQEVIIFFQEVSETDLAIAEEFGITNIISSETNIGIGPAIVSLVEQARCKYCLFLENDWILERNPKLILKDCVDALDEGLFDFIRLRSSSNPGDPLYTRQFEGRELDCPQHLLDSQHWLGHSLAWKYPEIVSLHVAKFSSFVWTNSFYGSHTNNPAIFSKKFYLEHIAPFAGSGVELEGKIINYWRSANFKVAHNIPSLFTHKRLDR